MWVLRRKLGTLLKRQVSRDHKLYPGLVWIDNSLNKLEQCFMDSVRSIRPSSGALPDFLIVGAQKAGTTSLFHYVGQHPCVRTPFRKEVHYFDRNYYRSIEWYRSFFPSERRLARNAKGSGALTGEATPDYMVLPCYQERMKKDLKPETKFVVCLRNPVDRAFSHFQMERNLGNEPEANFERALDLEEDRLTGEVEKICSDPSYDNYKFRHYSYKTRGRYSEQLKNLFSLFDRSQVYALKSEDLFCDPARVTKGVFDFLGLHDFQLGSTSNIQKGSYRTRVADETRDLLNSYFAPYNKELYELLGKDLDWE